MHVRTSSPFIQPKRSLVTWLITLLLFICPSSYKARPDNLIGPNSFCSGIVSPQRSNARPNFLTSNVVGGAKFVWHPGYLNRHWSTSDPVLNRSRTQHSAPQLLQPRLHFFLNIVTLEDTLQRSVHFVESGHAPVDIESF